MARIVSVLLLGISCVSAFGDDGPLLVFNSAPIKIVCLGDSVTGVYYHTGGRRAYPELLETALRELYPKTDIKVVNAGISGHTTINGLERLDTDVLAHHPQLVTVAFGLNDVTRVTPEMFRANLLEIASRCQAQRCKVVLCTPNAVITTSGRPTEKVEQYCDIIRSVAQEKSLPLCDQYAAQTEIRKKDAWTFRLLLSDEIHPNLTGHKRMAEELVRVISGKTISLDDLPADPTPLDFVDARVRAGKPIRIAVMPPFQSIVIAELKRRHPAATVEVLEWPSGEQTLAMIEQFVRDKIRGWKPDLVVLAIPRSAYGTSSAVEQEPFVRSYTWVMNWSLSYGQKEWDCLVIHPSVVTADRPDARDPLVRKLVAAQDLQLIDREAGDPNSFEQLLQSWFSNVAISDP